MPSLLAAMCAQRSDVGQPASDPLEVSDIGLDDILDAAGLDDPARRRHATRERLGAALARAQGEAREDAPDAFADLHRLELDDSAPEAVFEAGDKPFRYSAPPLPGFEGENSSGDAAAELSVDPHGDTFAGPLPEGLAAALPELQAPEAAPAPEPIDAGPTLMLERETTRTARIYGVSEHLERGMQGGSGPIGPDLGEAPTIDPEHGVPGLADALRVAQALAPGDCAVDGAPVDAAAAIDGALLGDDSTVDGIPLGDDSTVDGIPLGEDSAVDGIPLGDDSAVDGVPLEDAADLLSLDVAAFDSVPPGADRGHEFRPSDAMDSLSLDLDGLALEHDVASDVAASHSGHSGHPPAPAAGGRQETYVLQDLPEGTRARLRREQTDQTDRSVRRRVMHGEEARVLGRASVSSRAYAGVREERNSARDRGMESLLLDYVRTAFPEPLETDGNAPAAGILRKRRSRKKTR